ncbi:hypothetical protein ACA910_001223 [Epithemia clementina (nom. ined.)]
MEATTPQGPDDRETSRSRISTSPSAPEVIPQQGGGDDPTRASVTFAFDGGTPMNDSPTSQCTDRAVAKPKRINGHAGVLRPSKKGRISNETASTLMDDESYLLEDENDENQPDQCHVREVETEVRKEDENIKTNVPLNSSVLDERSNHASTGTNTCESTGSTNNISNTNNVSTEWTDMAKDLRNLLETQTVNNQQRIEEFLDGVEHRRAATTELEQFVEECQRTMDESLQTLMQQVVVQVHNHCQAQLGELDPEIVNIMAQNHNNRTRLLRRIERAQQAYMNRNNNLLARVENPSSSLSKNNNAGDGDGDVPSPDNSPRSDSSSPNEVQDPDWDLLVMEHEPNRDKVRLFLEGRARKAQAEDSLEVAVQQVHLALKEHVLDAMIQSAVRTHEHSEAVLGGLEQDIQDYIFSNHQRRQAFKKSLEESTKRARGFFADTLARVRAGIGNVLVGQRQHA